ncbi:Crp/Fnr family transcriptional regulator [Listeria booriae]|uniref:Crp/Fnr family transcriptional regulator n=1 Tax=Listeria booriae TaxID=1552123 RepID=A0A7X0XTJ3_9LIST|nr:Crp/Fnr family transcriptional regulator [Listeria booriae]MBC1779992.1 Crp/Fnr family transcriptional regulator [Listeria booriae]
MMDETKIIELKKGEILKEDGTYKVLSGRLICKTTKQLLYFTNIGDWIIVDPTFFQNAFHYEAKEKVILADVAHSPSFNGIKARHELQWKITIALIERVDSCSEPMKRRFMLLLYQVGRESGYLNDKDVCVLPNVLTHRELSKYVGCTREYLSSMRKQLIKEGRLSGERGWVLLKWSEWQDDLSR